MSLEIIPPFTRAERRAVLLMAIAAATAVLIVAATLRGLIPDAAPRPHATGEAR